MKNAQPNDKIGNSAKKEKKLVEEKMAEWMSLILNCLTCYNSIRFNAYDDRRTKFNQNFCNFAIEKFRIFLICFQSIGFNSKNETNAILFRKHFNMMKCFSSIFSHFHWCTVYSVHI